MATHYEKEFGITDDDTEIDTQLEQVQVDDDEARTQPFNEVAQAEAAIERSRERVERSVSALRNAIARRTDWRAWVSRRPAVFLGAAVVLGFLWGYRRRGGRSSNRR